MFRDYSEFQIEIIKCRNLLTLGLAWIEISEIPESIGNLKLMQSIHLSDKKFDKFPLELKSCIHPRTLPLSNNNIQNIPDKITGFTSLTLLDLKNNNISQINNNIFRLSNLEILILFKYPGNMLPKTLCEAKKLRVLDIRKTEIESLPACITQLNLKSIRTKGPKIPVEEIKRLIKLMPDTRFEY